MIILIPYSKYIGHPIAQNKVITDIQTKAKQSILAAKNTQSTFPINKHIDEIDKFSALLQCGKIPMNHRSKIGEGSYGVAYRLGHHVVKIPKYADEQAPSYATCKRTSRILNEVNGHDFYVQGNVKKDKQSKLYLIDADQVTLSYQGRRNSIASEEFYEDFECFRGEELVVPKRMK